MRQQNGATYPEWELEFGAFGLGAEPAAESGRSFPQVLICLPLVIEREQHSVSGRAVPPWAARQGDRGLCGTTETGPQ